MLKKLQKYIRKGWLNGWLDEKTETLYLTAEDYRAAQEARAAVQAEPEPKAEPQAEPQETPLNLETTRRFAKVLAQEQQLMQDAQGVEELAHMQKTTEAICDWLEAHPESLPKARRFAEYYIPTTSSSCTPTTMCRARKAIMPRASAGTSRASCIRSIRRMTTSTIIC